MHNSNTFHIIRIKNTSKWLESRCDICSSLQMFSNNEKLQCPSEKVSVAACRRLSHEKIMQVCTQCPVDGRPGYECRCERISAGCFKNRWSPPGHLCLPLKHRKSGGDICLFLKLKIGEEGHFIWLIWLTSQWEPRWWKGRWEFHKIHALWGCLNNLGRFQWKYAMEIPEVQFCCCCCWQLWENTHLSEG